MDYRSTAVISSFPMHKPWKDSVKEAINSAKSCRVVNFPFNWTIIRLLVYLAMSISGIWAIKIRVGIEEEKVLKHRFSFLKFIKRMKEEHREKDKLKGVLKWVRHSLFIC